MTAQGNTAAAAGRYQKIFVEHPFSQEASEAESALANYPAPAAAALEGRAFKLIDGGDYTRARKELAALLPQLSGADLELARVRMGAAQYLAGEYKPAYQHLSSFQAGTAEVEAERLYYVAQCARHLDRIDEMTANLDRLVASLSAIHVAHAGAHLYGQLLFGAQPEGRGRADVPHLLRGVSERS